MCVCSVAQSYPTLCNPMNYSLPGSSAHVIFQATELEWVATSYSRDLPNPGQTHVFCNSCISRWILYQLPINSSPHVSMLHSNIQLPKKCMQILTTRDKYNFHKSTIFNSQKLGTFLSIQNQFKRIIIGSIVTE